MNSRPLIAAAMALTLGLTALPSLARDNNHNEDWS
jgi:hypothetical protein